MASSFLFFSQHTQSTKHSLSNLGTKCFIIFFLSLLVVSLLSSSTDIHPNAQWKQNGVTVVGGNQPGKGINQLSNSCSLYVDDDQTIYVADKANHRIIGWKSNATSGQLVAGGN